MSRRELHRLGGADEPELHHIERTADDRGWAVRERPGGRYTIYPDWGGSWESLDIDTPTTRELCRAGRQMEGTCDVRAPRTRAAMLRWLRQEAVEDEWEDEEDEDTCRDVCCAGKLGCPCGGSFVHVGFGPMCDTCGAGPGAGERD